MSKLIILEVDDSFDEDTLTPFDALDAGAEWVATLPGTAFEAFETYDEVAETLTSLHAEVRYLREFYNQDFGPAEGDFINEFNQHYLANHGPLPEGYGDEA